MQTENIWGGFRKRNLPINADYRPMYKIGLIVLILRKVCINEKSSLNKLHFFVWALKSKKNIDFIKALLISEETPVVFTWGVEPALNKALNFCLYDGLVEMSGNKYALSKKGIELAKKIESKEDLLVKEKVFLDSIGKRKVTESYINSLTNNLTI